MQKPDGKNDSKFYKPKFTYYLTTRGLNVNGQILSLEYLPKWFHKYVTVVSVKENKKAITEKYPRVGYWSNPESINTASLKRKWLFENSKADDFFFINDETRLYTSIGDGKARGARDAPHDFSTHVQRLEELTNYYVGVAANQKLFSNGLLNSHAMLRENYVLGTWFHWNRKFALKKLELDRVNYCDDVDYVLQAMKMGYRVCNYAGILYEHRTTTPQRQHNDRTVVIQERDTKKLIKMHPECISRKAEYDPVTQDIGIAIRFGPAYRPKRKVVIAYTKATKREALACYLMLMKLKKNISVKIVRLDMDPKTTGKNANTETLNNLRELDYPSPGINEIPATVRTMNMADVVLTFSKSDVDLGKKMFPRTPDRYSVLACKYSMKDKPRKALKSIESQIKQWIADKCPVRKTEERK